MSFVLECVLVDLNASFKMKRSFFPLLHFNPRIYGLGVEMSAALYSKLDPGEKKNFKNSGFDE